VIVVYALLGFVLGAAINALADALPLHQSIVMPAYLARRAPPRFRDLAVHVAAAGLFAFLWAQYAEQGLIQLMLVSVYALVLLLITVTDLEHKLIPDKAIVPAIGVAALASPIRFGAGWPYALLGGAIGFLFFFVAFWLGGRMLGRGALGFGDVKLAAFIGLISGFPQIFVALVVALIAGGAISLALLLTRRATFRTAIPYGPFIVIGGFYAMVWGTEVVRWYAGQF
jgi:leader peptidase (prepilin peptidase)/N-methyltransferase